MMDGVTAGGLSPLTQRASDTPEKIKSAAQQFEALLITELMKNSREDGSSGWLGTGDDKAGETGMELATEYLSSAMAKNGGLGLAKLLTQGLTKA